MMIPIAMAVIAIFIIGLDILLLWCFDVVNLFAMKYSKFNGIGFDANIVFLSG